MTSGSVQLHAIRPTESSDISVLSPIERKRADSFRFREDALRWISYRTAMRSILGERLGISPVDVPIRISERGKPYLEGPREGLHFNLSHTNCLAILAISTAGPVGVDLEPMDRAADLLECESSFCHPLEIAGLPDDPAVRQDLLLQLWTMKEAVLKAVGTGFLLPPESIRIETDFGSMHRAISAESQDLFVPQKIQRIDHPSLVGYRVAVSSLQQTWYLIDSGASTGTTDPIRVRP